MPFKQLADAVWFTVGVLTPIDEFYLLGQAFKIGTKGFRAIRFVTVKAFARANKIEVKLADEGLELKNLSNSKIDEFVSWVTEGIAKEGDDWLLWSQYTKKIISGEEFAVVGNRYFSKSAVESMVPSGLGGSGVPPSVIDDIITNGKHAVFNAKSYNTSLDAVVITENNGTIVRSITKISDRTAETSLGLTNSYKATNLEIEAATARIKEVRASGGTAGNYGYINGEVSKSGVVIDKNKIWASGDANVLLEPQIFDAIEVAGKDGVKYLRNTESV